MMSGAKPKGKPTKWDMWQAAPMPAVSTAAETQGHVPVRAPVTVARRETQRKGPSAYVIRLCVINNTIFVEGRTPTHQRFLCPRRRHLRQARVYPRGSGTRPPHERPLYPPQPFLAYRQHYRFTTSTAEVHRRCRMRTTLLAQNSGCRRRRLWRKRRLIAYSSHVH